MKRVLCLCLLAGTLVQAQEIVIREGVGIRTPGARRSAVHIDPVEFELVSGTWVAPVAGKDGWAAIKANDKGEFTGGPVNGGYVFATVDAPAAKTMLLEASGHSLVYVNGVPRAGDPYSYGYVALPIALKKGKNELLFQCGRGRLTAKLTPITKPLAFDLRDSTLPDVLTDLRQTLELGLVVRNATPVEVLVTVASEGDLGSMSRASRIPAMSVRKIGVPARTSNGRVALKLLKDGVEADRFDLELRVKKSTDIHKRTFISQIDDSVQYYGVNPSLQPAPDQALFLSLHGASVEAIGQAEAYSQKNWGTLVAATNRRPYGFDWEEIGRLDALEVLREARTAFDPNPARIYLTGHSMGGHGTWNIGALFPGLFAAIAPSAGWISFQSYANGQQFTNPSPVEQMLLRAGLPSDTLAFKNNLMQRGIFILHGDADDNVPVAQARQMREALAGHPDLRWVEQKGAGHWWDADPEPGADAVDYFGIFDFFSRHRLPRFSEVRTVDFTTASPSISSQMHWATIHQQIHPFELSRIQLKVDPQLGKFSGSTDNVKILSLSIGALTKGQKIELEIDGQKLTPTWPTVNRIFLYRMGDSWTTGGDPNPAEKSPERGGGFKDIFRNHVLFVYGTKGNAQENAWSVAKARYDAETFWYRGNGSPEVVSDEQFARIDTTNRNVLVYGNASTNGAWKTLLATSPIQVDRSAVRMGSKVFTGPDLAAVFIQPRKGSDIASVGVVAGTGLPGSKLCDRLPYFTSGAAFPDFIVYGADSLQTGSKGLRAAGFFANDWSLGPDVAYGGEA